MICLTAGKQVMIGELQMYDAYIYIRSNDLGVSRKEIEYLEDALKERCDDILHRCVGVLYFIGDDYGETVFLQNMINDGAFRDVNTIIVPYSVSGRRINYNPAYRLFRRNKINIKIFVENMEV